MCSRQRGPGILVLLDVHRVKPIKYMLLLFAVSDWAYFALVKTQRLLSSSNHSCRLDVAGCAPRMPSTKADPRHCPSFGTWEISLACQVMPQTGGIDGTFDFLFPRIKCQTPGSFSCSIMTSGLLLTYALSTQEMCRSGARVSNLPSSLSPPCLPLPFPNQDFSL